MTSPDDAPTPAPGVVRPDDAVLDELSQAFAAPDEPDQPDQPDEPDGFDGSDDSAEPAADDPHEVADPQNVGDLHDVDEAPDVDESHSAPLASVTELDTIRLGDDDRSGPATISIGGDDDLPDAVYLDDHLASIDDVAGTGSGRDGTDGSGATVFIDDDGIGDALAPKDATAPGIEPRIRQRRIGVNRAANRRRLKWIALSVAVLAVVIGVLTVLGSGLFAIQQVAVQGDVYTDQERLDAVIADLEGTPVLLADTDAAERELEAIPWVDDARVRTQFPDGATIEIRERTPVATMRGADGLFRVLDAEGRVLAVIEGQPVALVLIAGPGTLDLPEGAFAPIGQASAASLVTKLTPTIRPRVEFIQVTDDGADLVMTLSADVATADTAADPAFVPPNADPDVVPADGVEETDVAAPADSVQTSSILVRFGSAIGDRAHIEKLVRLEKKLAELPDRNITEINVATNEVTEL